MTRLKTQSIILSMIVLLVSLGTAADKSAGGLYFKTELSGNEEVPPLRTNARGEATFALSTQSDELTYRVTIEGIENITSAHIHKGKKGESGPAVVDLFREPRKETVSGMFLCEGTLSDYELIGPLKGKSLKSLIEIMEGGDAYMNVRTKDHPEGEIRGQITPVKKQGAQPK